mmetsp:Transcript_38243/g.83954  ORF Transcript_38243/g.83954 Transcript_38243/m.83954 type:complete len:81 (+) Transcript_38243:201-443(+)
MGGLMYKETHEHVAKAVMSRRRMEGIDREIAVTCALVMKEFWDLAKQKLAAGLGIGPNRMTEQLYSEIVDVMIEIVCTRF